MLVLVIVICLVVSFAVLAVGCKDKQQNDGYTYTSYSTALATNWNPHTWETNADQDIYYYLTTPLVDMSIKNSTTGEYQWVYEMATDVKDVTADHRDDLSKFGTDVKDATKVSEGYVYEISLNQNAKWENGVKITADDYIYSMQQLLNPDMKNYRANLYLSGESALAGAYEYYYSKDDVLYKTVQEAGYASNDEAIAKAKRFISTCGTSGDFTARLTQTAMNARSTFPSPTPQNTAIWLSKMENPATGFLHPTSITTNLSTKNSRSAADMLLICA